MENGGRSTVSASVIFRSLPSSNFHLPIMNFPPPTPGQARVIWLAVSALAGAVIVAILAGVIWGFGQVLHLLSPVLWPLAVAGGFPFLPYPVVGVIERRGAPRPRGIICVFSRAAVILLALFGGGVPPV